MNNREEDVSVEGDEKGKGRRKNERGRRKEQGKREKKEGRRRKKRNTE